MSRTGTENELNLPTRGLGYEVRYTSMFVKGRYQLPKGKQIDIESFSKSIGGDGHVNAGRVFISAHFADRKVDVMVTKNGNFTVYNAPTLDVAERIIEGLGRFLVKFLREV